jgi:hypothetical protein
VIGVTPSMRAASVRVKAMRLSPQTVAIVPLFRSEPTTFAASSAGQYLGSATPAVLSLVISCTPVCTGSARLKNSLAQDLDGFFWILVCRWGGKMDSLIQNHYLAREYQFFF